jgi:hypothetical protein
MRRHQPILEQGRWLLGSAVRGHCAYYVIPGNSKTIRAFQTQATRHWHRALRRRSQRTCLNWERMDRLATRWLPQAGSRIHGRACGSTFVPPRQEPIAVIPLAGICAGGPPARAVPTATAPFCGSPGVSPGSPGGPKPYAGDPAYRAAAHAQLRGPAALAGRVARLTRLRPGGRACGCSPAACRSPSGRPSCGRSPAACSRVASWRERRPVMR